MLVRTMSSQIFNTSEDRNFTASLDILAFFKDTITGEKVKSNKGFFFCLNGISCIYVCFHWFFSCHWAPLRRIWLQFYILVTYPWDFCTLNSPSSLNIPSLVKGSKLLAIFIAIWWIHLRSSCLSHTWAQIWTQNSRYVSQG